MKYKSTNIWKKVQASSVEDWHGHAFPFTVNHEIHGLLAKHCLRQGAVLHYSSSALVAWLWPHVRQRWEQPQKLRFRSYQVLSTQFLDACRWCSRPSVYLSALLLFKDARGFSASPEPMRPCHCITVMPSWQWLLEVLCWLWMFITLRGHPCERCDWNYCFNS